jgi:hypothetical protein
VRGLRIRVTDVLDLLAAGLSPADVLEELPELERLLGELSVLSNSLRRLSEQTERNPSGLLFGRMPVPAGPGEISNGPQSR